MNEKLIGHGHRLTEFVWECTHFLLFVSITSYAATLSLIIKSWACGEVTESRLGHDVAVGSQVRAR